VENGIKCESPMIRTGENVIQTEAACNVCPFENIRCEEKVQPIKHESPPVQSQTEIKEGAGTQLYKLFKEDLGIEIAGCAGCAATLFWMNAIGVDDCEKRVAQIVNQIEENKRTSSIDWSTTINAYLKGASKLFSGWLNPLHPIRSCVYEAIRRERECHA